MTDPQLKAQLDALEAFPETLKRKFQNLDEGALRYRPATEAWSMVEIVGHIMEVEALWAGRIRHMLASDHPTFPPYNPDEIVRQREFQSKQAGGLLTTFAERRAELVSFLRGLRPAQLARTGVHPTRGPISVADSIAVLESHDRAHADQIAANLAAYTS